MKTLVVYKSRHGATEKYANFIASELSCKALDTAVVTPEDINDAELIIYGGGVYAGAVAGSAFLTKNKELLADKGLIVFTVGLSAADSFERNTTAANNVPVPLVNKKDFFLFHFMGGLDYRSLGFMDKVLIGTMISGITRKPADLRDERENAIVKAKKEKIDLSDMAQTAALLARARDINAPRDDGFEDEEEEDLYADDDE